MRRVVALLGVIGISVSLAGCEALTRFTADTNTGGKTANSELTLVALLNDGQVRVYISVEEARLSLEDVLRRLRLPVNVSTDPSGAVRITSATPDGARFSMVLTSVAQPSTQPGAPAAQTHIALEWENAADSKRGVQFLLEAVVPGRRTK